MERTQNGNAQVLIWPGAEHWGRGIRRPAGLLTLSIYSSVTLAKSLIGSKAQFPRLQVGAENGPPSPWITQRPWVLRKSKSFRFQKGTTGPTAVAGPRAV